MALIKRESTYSERTVSGEVLASEIMEPKKVPIYFANGGFICGGCDQFMVEETPRKQKVKVYCANVNCSENLLTKQITLPSITDYVICPAG